MKKCKRIQIRSIIFFIITFILAFYILFSAFASNKQTINVFQIKGFRVASPSMEPYLMTNDIVFVRKIKEKNLKEGDIITFETYVEENGFFGKIVVTHYIGSIEEKDGETIYKTQAHRDLNTDNYDENWLDKNKQQIDLTFNDILGKYAFKIPWIGHIIVFIQNIFKNPVLLVLAFLNIAIIYALYKVFKTKKNNENDDALKEEN